MANWFVDYNQIARTFDKPYERKQYADVERVLLEFVGNDPELNIPIEPAEHKGERLFLSSSLRLSGSNGSMPVR